jgi:hypothetical protein
MLRKFHGTNVFHIKLLDHTNIKCQNGPVLPPSQVFYFNGQALEYLFKQNNKNQTTLLMLMDISFVALLTQLSQQYFIKSKYKCYRYLLT